MIKSNLFRRLFYNWHIKLISLALAFILWKYVDSLNEKERHLSIRLTVKNVPQGYLIVSEIPKYIKITIKGKEEYLSEVDPSDFKAYIDLGDFPHLPPEIPVEVEKLNVPRNIVIKDVNPSNVMVRIEKLVEKVVKVQPVIVGKPRRGYFVEDIEINPSMVKIRGPSSEIRTIDEIYTQEIDINNIGLTESFDVPLILKHFKNIEIIGNNYVNILIRIVEKYELLQINDIGLKFLNLKQEFNITPNEVLVSVKIKLSNQLSDIVSKDDILAYVDCESVKEIGKITLPIQIKVLRKGIEIVEYNPKEVEVMVKKSQK